MNQRLKLQQLILPSTNLKNVIASNRDIIADVVNNANDERFDITSQQTVGGDAGSLWKGGDGVQKRIGNCTT